MAIPNPNPNIADGIKCDNKTYSSNKIESLISAATELPIPEAGDAGKVLTVNAAEDGYELDTPVTHDPIVGTATATADTTSGAIAVVAFTDITIPDGYVIAAASDNSVSGELVGAPVSLNDAENKIVFTYYSSATRTGRNLTIKYLLVYTGS